MKEAFEQAVKGRAFEYAVIPVSSINFCQELLKACEENKCGNYNKSWTCPPATGAPEKIREKITAFNSAFVFTTKFDLEDSFDYEGMMKAKDFHDRLTAEVHEKFGRTNPVFGAGACKICATANTGKGEGAASGAGKTCAYPGPCRFPDKIFLSIEAAGINVTELSRAGGLRYNNGENTVTYFSMILFDDCCVPNQSVLIK